MLYDTFNGYKVPMILKITYNTSSRPTKAKLYTLSFTLHAHMVAIPAPKLASL